MGPWDGKFAGLHASCARWLKQRDVAVLGSDAASDVLPSGVDGVPMPVHQLCLVAMGTWILDNCDLEALGAAAEEQKRHDFLLVVAPLAEEFFFRRVLQEWLEKYLGGDDLAPVLLSSLAFAAAHAGQGLAYVPLFPFSLVLGFIAQRTGSIVPCILLHALFNAVSVVLLLAQPVVVPAG